MMDDHGDPTFLVADRDRVERILDRLADRIRVELGTPAVVGIRRRGAPLAEAIARRLGAAGAEVPLAEVTLKRYSDDLEVLHERVEMEEPDLPFDVAGSTVLLVDDVLYTGHTMMAAAGWFADAGAERIRIAVVCSRGTTAMPVRADYVGMRLDVGEDAIVEVGVPPYESDLGVELRRRPD